MGMVVSPDGAQVKNITILAETLKPEKEHRQKPASKERQHTLKDINNAN